MKGFYYAMKTYLPKTEEIDRKWYVVDASEKTLGRLATRIATVLRGKHKPSYTPSVDVGDFIVVVNAEKIGFTGNKAADKMYYNHSGYPGGMTSTHLGEMIEQKPEEVIKRAVWGMLPKGTLGRRMFKKLKVYAGPEHPHKAQKPEAFEK